MEERRSEADLRAFVAGLFFLQYLDILKIRISSIFDFVSCSKKGERRKGVMKQETKATTNKETKPYSE
jgi:hypothetical protein